MLTFQGKAAHRIVVKPRVAQFEAFRLMTTITIKLFKLTLMRILVTAVTALAFWLPPVPSMAIQTQRIFMLSSERPSRALMLKIHLTQETLGHVAIITGQ